MKVELNAIVTITRENGEIFTIRKGDEIHLITDQTDYDDEYTGFITSIDESEIQIDSGDRIPWFHITDVNKQ